MKKMIIWLFIISLIAGVLFFLGWSSFLIPMGSYGVLVSKTNGVHPKIIESGKFQWDWELLIPTNAKIQTYKIKPSTVDVSISDHLPMATVYKEILDNPPDFFWQINFLIQTKIKEPYLPILVKDTLIDDQESLDAYHQNRTEDIAKTIISKKIFDLIEKQTNETQSFETYLEFEQELQKTLMSTDFQDIEIMSISNLDITLPDFSLYHAISKAYADFQEQRTIFMSEFAENQAFKSTHDFFLIERLTKWGEILSKYPVLIDFIDTTKNDGLEQVADYLDKIN